jgi:hypothetical protein
MGHWVRDYYSEERDGRLGLKRLHACIMYMTMQAYQTASSLLSPLPVLVLSVDSRIASSNLDAVMIANIVKLALLLQSYHVVSPTTLIN